MNGLKPADAIVLWLVAFAASAIVGTHGILYWDAGDYVCLAIDGGSSGLLLGRPLFLFISRCVLSLGVDPAWAEPVLRWFWTALGVTAAPAMAVLASRLGLDRRASWVAGLMLALSPSFAHTAHQVLTDAPALALSIFALAAAARSQAIAAGALLGAAILTRETAVIHVVALAILLGRRAIVALAAMATMIAVTLWIWPPAGLSAWFGAMSRSAGANPISAAGVGLSLVWVLAAGPLGVVAGLIAFTRRLPFRLLAVSLPAAIATAALLFYPDGSFSARYVLAAAPIAFFLPAATLRTLTPRWLAAGLLLPIALTPIAMRPSQVMANRGASVMARVPALPAHALIVPGHYCPQARLAATIHHRPDFDLLCPGWDWPANPAATLDAALAAGQPVAVDLADNAWWGVREAPNRDAIRAWAVRHTGDDVAGFLIVRRP
jgi:hypothetical protein